MFGMKKKEKSQGHLEVNFYRIEGGCKLSLEGNASPYELHHLLMALVNYMAEDSGTNIETVLRGTYMELMK